MKMLHGHTQRKRYVHRASSGDVPLDTARCARRESSTSSRYAIPCSLSTRTRELGLGRPACDTTTSTSTRFFNPTLPPCPRGRPARRPGFTSARPAPRAAGYATLASRAPP